MNIGYSTFIKTTTYVLLISLACCMLLGCSNNQFIKKKKALIDSDSPIVRENIFNEGRVIGTLDNYAYASISSRRLFWHTEDGNIVHLARGKFYYLSRWNDYIYFIKTIKIWSLPKTVQLDLCRYHISTGKMETIVEQCVDYFISNDKIIYRAGYDRIGYHHNRKQPSASEKARQLQLFVADMDGTNEVQVSNFERQIANYVVVDNRVIYAIRKDQKGSNIVGNYNILTGESGHSIIPDTLSDIQLYRFDQAVYYIYTESRKALYYKSLESLLAGEPPVITLSTVYKQWIPTVDAKLLKAYIKKYEDSIEGYIGCEFDPAYEIYPCDGGYLVYRLDTNEIIPIRRPK